ncbi:MAG: hypothetical protein AAF384_02860 [Pseudomonadota bacterium]
MLNQSVLRLFVRNVVIGFASAWLAFANGPALAEDKSIEFMRMGIPHDSLYAIDFHGEKGTAIGGFGTIMESTDGGQTWTQAPAITPAALLAVKIGEEKSLMVGQSGTVATREGDGAWELIDSGIEQRLLGVGMNSQGLAVVVGEFGYVAKSTDFGKTWSPLTQDWLNLTEEGYEPHLYDAEVFEDGRILIAGEFGVIMNSTDGGASFDMSNRADQSVFDVHFANDGTNSGWAVGQDGFVAVTKDNGLSWERKDAGAESNLLGVWSGNGEIVICGIRSLLRSSDDGASWTFSEDLNIIRTWFQGIDAGVVETTVGEGFLRQQIVYLAGFSGAIARVME